MDSIDFSLMRHLYDCPSRSQVIRPAAWSSLKWCEMVERDSFMQEQILVKALSTAQHPSSAGMRAASRSFFQRSYIIMNILSRCSLESALNILE